MRYFLDCEFNGMGGALISLALVAEDGRSIYLVDEIADPVPWVAENVMPVLYGGPYAELSNMAVRCKSSEFCSSIEAFMFYDMHPHFVSDWPDDIAYLCRAMITAPGKMILTSPRITFEVARVDAYPTALKNAVQHNAWWDAKALRLKVDGEQK